jgi:Zn-dependent protease with chaperone function
MSPIERSPVPSIPRWRLLLAVASVPGVYLVLALSAALSLGVAAGLVYVTFGLLSNAERVPVKLLLIVALVAIGGVYGFFAVLIGTLKSLAPKPDLETAVTLSDADEPELWRFVRDLCGEVGCSVPDHILLSAGPSFHVRQGAVETFTGRVQGRLLTLGCPLLRSLTVSEFAAVLAHEFAHFTGNDTLYSAFVAPVYVSIGASLQQMERVFSSTDQNAGWMSVPMILPARVLSLYLRAFHMLNADLSRLREKRADALAALHAGSDSLAGALRKLVREGGLFEAVHGEHIVRGLSKQRAFVNYYEVFREIVSSAASVQDDLEKAALDDRGTPGDSHPPLKERLAALPDSPGTPQDTRLSRGLLTKPQELEESLTQLYTSLVAQAIERAGPVYYAPGEAGRQQPVNSPHLVPADEPPTVCAGCGKTLAPGVTFCPDCNDQC